VSADPRRAAHGAATALLALFLLSATLVSACADFDAVLDPGADLPDVEVADPSFSAHIQPIFSARCATGGCHSVRSARAGLVLAEGHAYDLLVNEPSVLSDSGLLRVEPGDPANSWLVRMISPDSVAREGRPRMPLATVPLTANQIVTIVNWIADGAPRN
jgi:hypothetical protein